MMDAFLILTAILISVGLVVGVAIPVAKPVFAVGERLSEAALVADFDGLGKKCAVTRKGFGIAYRKVDIVRLIKSILKHEKEGVELELWEKALLDGGEQFLSAYSRALSAVRLLHTVGHVDGVPRLFMFCNELVKACGGDVTRKKLDIALSAFEKNAAFTEKERDLLPGTLLYCVLGYVQTCCNTASIRKKRYIIGCNDGKENKADLDKLYDDDYSCGLYAATRAVERSSLINIFENNGVDYSEISGARKNFLAETYAVIRSAQRSMRFIEKLEAKQTRMIVEADDASVKRKTIVVAAASLIVIISATVCFSVFLPYRYAAIVFVATIAFYACLRLTATRYMPFVFLNKAFDGLALLRKRIFKRKPEPEQACENRVRDCEIAYFGCEPELIENVIHGNTRHMHCDNRGRIRLIDDHKKTEDIISVALYTEAERITLCDCDGAHEKNKSAYRCYDDGIEFSVQSVNAAREDCFCAVVTLINRTDSARRLRIAGAMLVDKHSKSSDGFITMSIDDNKRTVERSARKESINVQKEIVLAPFEKSECMLIAAFGNCSLQSERLCDMAAQREYFDFLCDCSFARTDRSVTSDTQPTARSWRFVARKKLSERYGTPELTRADYAVKCDNGGYMQNGEYVFELGNCADRGDAINVLSGKNASINTYVNSINDICIYNGSDKCSDIKNDAIVFDDALLVLADGDTLWSPVAGVFGRGKFSVTFGFGHTTYFCAYNGCICKLNCFTAKENGAVLFDLTIENTERSARKINVMFSAIVKGALDLTKEMSEEILQRVNLLCSEKIDGFARFKEAYYVRGHIDRARDFRAGGNTVAPTASVSVHIEGESQRRLVFALTVDEDNIKTIDVDTADRLFGEVGYGCGGGRVKLNSSDVLLNVMHRRAERYAMLTVMSRSSVLVKYCAAISGAVKYMDTDAVSEALARLFGMQKYDGTFTGDKYTGFGVVYAVCDLARFTGDFSFAEKHVPYAPHYVRGCFIAESGSLYEHCLRALKKLPCDYNVSGAYAERVLYCKAMLDILNFFKNHSQGPEQIKFDKAIYKVINNYNDAVKTFDKSKKHADGLVDTALFSAAEYCCGNYDSAYNALKTAVKLFASEASYSHDYAIGAAILYSVINERLLGVKFVGNTLKLDPKISKNCPHIEFETISETGGSARIIIDNSELIGDWRMRIDKVSYASDRIRISDNSSETIVFYKDNHSDTH